MCGIAEEPFWPRAKGSSTSPISVFCRPRTSRANFSSEAAIQAGKEIIVLARKGLIPPNDTLLKEIKASGVNVAVLTPKEKEAFKKATRSVYDKWAKQIGPELVKKAEQAVAKRK